MEKIKWKELLFSLFISLGSGILSWILTGDSMKKYETLPKPPFSPPGWVFPVVWTILFLLMGYTAYLVYNTENTEKGKALILYGIQLIVNIGWSIIFFRFELYFFAFVWLIFLWCLIILLIQKFGELQKKAGVLLYPYLFWVTFAGYLNLAIVLMK